MKIETNTPGIIALSIIMGGLILLAIIIGSFYYSSSRAKWAFQNGLIEVPDHTSSTHYGKQ